MNSEILESIDYELQMLGKYNSSIIGAAIVNRNGLLLVAYLPLEIDERKFGAMAAAIIDGMETASESLNTTIMHHLTVEFEEFQLLELPINDNLFIATLLNKDINFGLVLIEIEEFIRKVRIIIE